MDKKTHSLHRFKIGKVEIDNFCFSLGLFELIQKCLLSSTSRLMTFVQFSAIGDTWKCLD